MHFANKEQVHGKAVKACSFVLAMLIMCSMLFVGQVGDIKASAETIAQNSTFTISLNNDVSWWTSDGYVTYITWWTTDNDKRLKKIGSDWSFTFPEACNYFILVRIDPETATRIYNSDTETYHVGNWPTGDVANQTITCSSVGGNVLKLSNGGYNKPVNVEWITAIDLKGGNSFSATPGYANSSYSTGYGVSSESGKQVELYAANATFYDYLTDYELENGWRTNTNDYDISRTYLHRIPYIKFNKYISSLVSSSNGTWRYPLYFGNFTSHWGDNGGNFLSFPYGTLIDRYICDSSGSHYETGSTHMRNEGGISAYTDADGLRNFSIYANDSEAIESRTGDYSGNVQGLVVDTLSSGNLLMKTTNDNGTAGDGVISPYFSSSNYVNTVSTKFPLRVNDKNSATVTSNGNSINTTYTTYEFDSGAKGNGESDIIYFTYNSDGSTDKLNYVRANNGSSHEVIDAYQSLGGNNEGNHRGFFPFDNGGTGHDYGFGMKIKIPFNLTKDGCILGTDEEGNLYNTGIPMKFEFEGDDDVWVFIDDKLALDLGGDHGNSKGNIQFSVDNPTATAETHVVNLKSVPSYGSTEYDSSSNNGNTSLDTVSITNIFDADNDYITDGGNKYYDPTVTHYMTVFYMERGLVESNLKMSFSISPVGNNLIVDKEIDYSGANSIIQSRLKNYFEGNNSNEEFAFSVSDTTSRDLKYEKTDKSGNKKTITYDKTNGAIVNHQEAIKFENQIADGKRVTINETPSASKCKYQYTTTYTVIDKLLEQRIKNGKESGNEYVVGSADSGADATDPPNDFGGGKTSFLFKTNSSAGTNDDDVSYNDFAVSAVNKVKYGEVKLKKIVKDSTGKEVTDDTTFKFNVYIKLPHESEYQSKPDTTITLKAGETKTLSDLPIGSTVKFVEVLTTEEQALYEDETKKVELTVGETVAEETYTNKQLAQSVSADVAAAKTLDGSPSEIQFDFKLTKLDNGGKLTSDIQTSKNGTDGKISFNLSDLEANQTFNYLLEEQSESNSIYNFDTNKYWVEVKTSTDSATVKYYKTTVNGSTYIKGDEVTGGVTFINSTKPQKGSVKVTKKGSNEVLLDDVEITLVPAKNSGDTNDPNWQPKDGATSVTKETENGVALFEDVEPGDYVVYESKSVSQYDPNVSGYVGYELYGKYEYVNVVAGEVCELEIIDPVSTNLPATGGHGAVLLIIGGIVLVTLGVFMLKPPKKEKTSPTDSK